MMRIGLILGGVAALAISVYLVSITSYNQGIAEGAAKQAEADRLAYADIIERINNETLDPTDNAAVLRRLCELAGAEPDDPQCSGL